MNKDINTSYPFNRYPYHYMDMDGAVITIQRKTQTEIEVETWEYFEAIYGKYKAAIHIDQTEDHAPDLYGFAFRDNLNCTVIIVEWDDYEALINYSENAFSVSRFAAAVEKLAIPFVAAKDEDDDEE